MKPKIIIAIDGHASCGKSTMAKALAKHLQYIYVDSGAMYRAVTLYCLQQNISYADINAVSNNLANIVITFKFDAITKRNVTFLNGVDVSEAIRHPRVSGQVSYFSVLPEVRTFLVAQQRHIARNKGVVMDGRDIGTVVFPKAALKIFLTASIPVRAKRRYIELQQKGVEITLAAVENNLRQRDHIDSTRKTSPLRQAADAVLINNDNLSMQGQLALAIKLAEGKITSLS